MKFGKRFWAGLLVFASFAFVSGATDILVGDFTGTAPGVNTPWTGTSTLDPAIKFNGWARGAGCVGDSAQNDVFGFSVNATATMSSLQEALDENEYLFCSMEPATSMPLNLGGLRVHFGITRLSYHAPRRYAVFSDLTGLGAGDALFSTPSISSGDYGNNEFSFFLPASAFDNLTSPVQLRIYAYEANFNHKTSMTSFRMVSGISTYRLQLGAGPGGRAETTPDGSVHPQGTSISVRAFPDPGFRFAGWEGDLVGMGNPRALILDSDKATTALFLPNPEPKMLVGTNLNGVNDYGTDWPFTDLAKRMRSWQTRNEDGSGAWNSGFGDLAPTDEHGWVTLSPFNPGGANPPQFVHTVLRIAIPGTYQFIYEGTGDLRARTPGLNFVTLPTGGVRTHSFTCTTASLPATMYIEIRQTATPDHLRNFKIITPGFETTHSTEPFHPLYKERLEPFVNLRFMDWAHTNDCPLVTWSERATTATYTQSQSMGVALEYMIQMSNELGQDIWICVPHKADDDYVRRSARLLRDSVNPDLKIYVEYSNETWNSAGAFTQTVYVQNRGEALALDSDRWTAGQKYVSLRSVQIWRIFEEEFGAQASSRLVKVMATQSAGIGITNTRTDALNDPAINPDRIMPDALAIAPYFGSNYNPASLPPNVPAYPTIDEIVTTLSIARIAAVRQNVISQKRVADEQGWRLVCYEGGQHFVGTSGGENNTTLTALLTSANADPRMYDRYIEYLDMLEAEGVDLFSNFSYIGTWSKWGSWGVLRAQDEPIEVAHKYRALIDWIAGNATDPDPDPDPEIPASALRGVWMLIE